MKTMIACLLATLTGCASFDYAQTAIAANGAKASDEARITAEWTLCKGISVGAWRRGYAGNPEKSAAWAVLCNEPQGMPQ